MNKFHVVTGLIFQFIPLLVFSQVAPLNAGELVIIDGTYSHEGLGEVTGTTPAILLGEESGTATASAEAAIPNPVASVGGTLSLNCRGCTDQISGQAKMSYSFVPKDKSGHTGASVFVDMVTTASADATATGTFGAISQATGDASLDILNDPNSSILFYQMVQRADYPINGNPLPDTFQPLTILSLIAGDSYEVQMTADFTIMGDPSGATSFASAQSSVDPYFSIDPSTPNAQSYYIQVSDGIGNVPISPAPEPETWALFMAGIGVICLRRGLLPRRGACKATAAFASGN